MDYISSTSIIFPRIEGVIRLAHSKLVFNKGITQNSMAEIVLSPRDDIDLEFSLLLPRFFSKFLKDVYFANFDPQLPVTLSRNSISHGVAYPADFDLKSALLGILILDQLFFFLPN